MIKEIKKGDMFVCKANYIMDYGDIAFKKGKRYECLKDGTLDGEISREHRMSADDDFNMHFRLISTKTPARGDFQNYSKEYLDNMQELQAVCDAQCLQQVYTKAEQQFEDVVTDTLKQCQDTMLIKGREYRRNNNPFHNFDKGVEISGKSREEVIWGFALKHFISIQDIRSDLRDGKLPSEELLNEKYGDMINYLLIEKASIVARIKEAK